jgi:hypothetical protein
LRPKGPTGSSPNLRIVPLRPATRKKTKGSFRTEDLLRSLNTASKRAIQWKRDCPTPTRSKQYLLRPTKTTRMSRTTNPLRE